MLSMQRKSWQLRSGKDPTPSKTLLSILLWIRRDYGQTGWAQVVVQLGEKAMIQNRKILVTGATGQLAGPIAKDLATRNEVWVTSRFKDPAMRKRFEASGMKTCKWVLGSDDFSEMPGDFDYVIHAAADIVPVRDDYDEAIRVNAEGTGLLMRHCRRAKAFLFCSSMAIYEVPHDLSRLVSENSPLGSIQTYAPSYASAKIACEGVVRTLARIYDLPTIICRMGMCYGTMGWSIHRGAPTTIFEKMLAGEPVPISPRGSYYSLISEDDVVAHMEPFLRAASVPAVITNWGGDEPVKEREMCDYMAHIAGLVPEYVTDEAGTFGGVALGDPTFRKTITGPNKVHWKAGLFKALSITFPDVKFTAAN
jgi:nucleoside-diphosphate-sugar epimerase